MTTPDRNAIVDTLRTAALIGICVVNLPYMALPEAQTLSVAQAEPDQIAAMVTSVFFEAKFFILFSFLFGWGMDIQHRAAERAGADPGRRHWRRMVMLAMIGVLHAVFVFSGDILLLYSLVGSLIWPLRRASPGKLIRFALVMIALSLVCLMAISAALAVSPPILADAGSGLAGGYIETVLARLIAWPETLVFLILFQGPLAAGAFAAGLAAAKLDVLDPQATRWGRRCAFALPVLLAIGLPLNIAYGLVASGPGLGWGGLADLAGFLSIAVGGPVLTLAYICIIRLAGDHLKLPALLVLAGRNSLSSYVLQGVLAGLVFGGYGLGLFGQFGQAWLLPISIALALVSMMLVGLCARLTGRGPLEFVLRRVTYDAGESSSAKA
ncbi:DUF418 domain-containing protein [Oceanicaulis sp.]|uniref:DUF418 domain-containing protein n=1 Tax=Oceanicaulis sp. TaxID=1924941 RepID=UPI003F708FF2